jgi:hypothetical protein
MKYIILVLIQVKVILILSQQLDNNGFENWENIGTPTEEPIDWSSTKTSDTPTLNGFAPQVIERSSDAHSGSYSAKLTNKNVTLVNIVANGLLTNGRVHASTNPDNAYVFTDQTSDNWNQQFTNYPDSLTGWYKYSPQGSDIGEITVLIHSGSTQIPTNNTSNWIAVAEKKFFSTNNSWSRFSVPFQYLSSINSPQYILCVISAGDSTIAVQNSELLIDDIELIYNQPTSIHPNNENSIEISKSNKQIQIRNLKNSRLELNIYDLQGKILLNKIVSNSFSYHIDISSLTNGFYILKINSTDGITSYKFFK